MSDDKGHINGIEDELESEEGLSTCLEKVYPDAVIKINRDQISLYDIKHRIEDLHDLQLNPDFQRSSVWNNTQKVELI